MNSRRKLIGCLVSVICMSCLTACAKYKGGVVQFREPSQFANLTNSNGIAAGAEAYTDNEKVEEIFYIDVTEEFYFPIELSMQNGTSARILIERDRIELVSDTGSVLRPISVSAMADEFEKNKMAHAILGFGIFSYMSAEEANKKMASDWSEKGLTRETIINPRRSSSGFVYFKLPTDTTPNGMELVVPVEWLNSGAVREIRLRL